MVTVAGRVLGAHTDTVGEPDTVYPLLACCGDLSLAAGHAQRGVSLRVVVVGVGPLVWGPLGLATASPSRVALASPSPPPEVARNGHA